MKNLIVFLVLYVGLIFVSDANAEYSSKSKISAGLSFLGYYEINTGYESLYGNVQGINFKTAGIGVVGFVGYEFTDKISGELSYGHSHRLYSNTLGSQILKNFFVADYNFNFYLFKGDKLKPYLLAGAGAYFSTKAVAPTLNLGGGFRYQLSKKFSVKTELMYKTAFVLNRAEARVGIAYHF